MVLASRQWNVNLTRKKCAYILICLNQYEEMLDPKVNYFFSRLNLKDKPPEEWKVCVCIVDEWASKER